jgi:septal ring factor EnvC (AmiA/AmiB activator)
MSASDNDEVICPNCVHQFRAIPVNVQAELAAAQERLNLAFNEDLKMAALLRTEKELMDVEAQRNALAAKVKRLRKTLADTVGANRILANQKIEAERQRDSSAAALKELNDAVEIFSAMILTNRSMIIYTELAYASNRASTILKECGK